MSTHDPKDPYANLTNPKDLVAQMKLDLSVVPETLEIDIALAFLEGALKYGRFNWRMKPVKMSVYVAALKRHLNKLIAGEDCDQATGVKHLSYLMCCAAIMNDAAHYGTLIDDRPPRGRVKTLTVNPISAYIDDAQQTVAHLKQMFASHTPHQYTIADIFGEDPDRPGLGASAQHDSLPQVPPTKRKGHKKPVGKKFIRSTRSG